MKQLENKVAIVTGGASGIGKAIAEIFIRESAKVVISDVNDKAGNDFINNCDGNNAIFVKADSSSPKDNEKIVEAAIANFGALHVAVNNAGIGGESIQTVVLLIGAFIISYAAFDKMGGWAPMKETLTLEGELSKLSMLRPAGDGSGMPWYAVFLGYPILGIWYWCADQTIVQRVLGAKSENHGRVGALFCGFIKILPVFIFVLPGLFAFTLYKTGSLDLSSLGVDSAGNVNSKGIYTLMITQLLPSGLIGVLVAALLSGLMSQISGALNSISTMVSYDIYKQRKPHASDRQLIWAGKVSAVLAMIFSLALLPLLDKYESIFNGINDVIAHIAPPITCVFVVGVFWEKASAKSAKLTLWIGSALGVVVFLLNKLAPESWIGQIPFMMMAFYLFLVCVALQIVTSYWYPVVHTAQSRELYWRNPLEPLKGAAWRGLGNYRLLSGLLLFIVVILYGIFN